MPNNTLNQNMDDLSSSVTFCSWMSACPKPLSINIVEKARKMDIILTSPNSDNLGYQKGTQDLYSRFRETLNHAP